MYTPILETERLILRPLCVEDAPAVFAWASDERVAKYMTYPKHEAIDTTLEWLRSIDHSSDADYDFGFVEKTSGELIGSGGQRICHRGGAGNDSLCKDRAECRKNRLLPRGGKS